MTDEDDGAGRATTGHRRLPAILLLAGGFAALLGIVMFFVSPGVSNWWTFVIAAVAVALQFVVLGARGVFGSVGRLAFAAATVGWLLIGVVDLISGSAGVIGAVGEVIAVIGTAIAAICVYRARSFGAVGSLAYVVAMALSAVYLAEQLVPVLPPIAAMLVSVLFAAGLLFAGGINLRAVSGDSVGRSFSKG